MDGIKYVPVLSLLLMLLIDGTESAESSRGAWSQWDGWSDCSRTCGTGVQSRTSTWIEAKGEKKFDPAYTMTQNENCNTGPCPINGRWNGWGRWDPCSEPCNGGIKQRRRTCTTPFYGGEECEGEDFQEEECNELPCPPLPLHFNLTACSKKHFMCTSGKMCIPMKELCDDTVQCHDGSDEKRCYDVHDSSDGYRSSPVKETGSSHYGSLPLIGSLVVMVILTFVVG